MNKKAVVLSVEEGGVSVLPVAKRGCASCASACSKKEKRIVATNPRHFPLRAGDFVTIELSGRIQALQGLFSLFFPFCAAVLGYFAAGPVASRLSGRAADGVRALFVLLFLCIASVLVLAVTRLFPPEGKAEVVSAGGRSGTDGDGSL